MRYLLLLVISAVLGTFSYSSLWYYLKPQPITEVNQRLQIALTVQPEQSSPTASTIPEATLEAEDLKQNRAFENGLPLAARVNDQPIYLEDYERGVAQYGQAFKAVANDDIAGAAGQLISSQIEQQVLDALLDQLIIEQQAKSLGINVAEVDVETKAQETISGLGDKAQFEAWMAMNGLTYKTFVADLRSQLTAQELFEYVTRDVSSTAEQVWLRYIRLADLDIAQTIMEQLEGNADFNDLAQTNSLDKNRAVNGGDLGWFPRDIGVVPVEIETVAFSLQPGEIFGPIQTAQGIYIIKLEARESDRLLTADMLQILKKQIFNSWLQEKRFATIIEQYVRS